MCEEGGAIPTGDVAEQGLAIESGFGDACLGEPLPGVREDLGGRHGRRGPGSANGLRLLQLLGLVMGHEGVHDLVQASVQDLLEPVEGQPDPVVGDAALLEVVRADLLAAVAAPDLAAAIARMAFCCSSRATS